MVSQNLEDWEFALEHISDDLMQSSQLSASRQRVRGDVETLEQHVQACLNSSPHQFTLISSRVLQPD